MERQKLLRRGLRLEMHVERRRRQSEDMERHPNRVYMHDSVPIIWVLLTDAALKVSIEIAIDGAFKSVWRRVHRRRGKGTHLSAVSAFEIALSGLGLVCVNEPLLNRPGPVLAQKPRQRHIQGLRDLPEVVQHCSKKYLAAELLARNQPWLSGITSGLLPE